MFFSKCNKKPMAKCTMISKTPWQTKQLNVADISAALDLHNVKYYTIQFSFIL